MQKKTFEMVAIIKLYKNYVKYTWNRPSLKAETIRLIFVKRKQLYVMMSACSYPGIEPSSLKSPALTSRFFTAKPPWKP